MNSEQLPTPESEEPKPVHTEADVAPTPPDGENVLPKEQPGILYRVKWEDAKDVSRTQEFTSEVPIGPLEVTTKSFDGTTLVETPPSSLPAIEFITNIEGDAPRTLLDDDIMVYSSDDSDTSSRSSPVRNRRLPRDKAYPAPVPPRRVPITIAGRPRRRYARGRYAPIAFEDITITLVVNTCIRINSEDLLEAIRGVIRYYPPNRLSGDTVEILEPYDVLVHHFDELEDLQRQRGAKFDALCKQSEA